MNVIHTRVGDTEYRFVVSTETLEAIGPLDLAVAPIELVIPTAPVQSEEQVLLEPPLTEEQPSE